MLGQPKNGDARRKSALSSKLSSSRVRTQIGIRTILNSIPLPFANALSDCLQTWTAARTDMPCVPPSRSGGQRSRTARTRGVLSQTRAIARRTRRKVPAGPLTNTGSGQKVHAHPPVAHLLRTTNTDLAGPTRTRHAPYIHLTVM